MGRPVNSLGHQGWRRIFWEGPKFLNYVQHIFPGGPLPPAPLLVTGLIVGWVPWLLSSIHLRPFIWDHVNLRPRHFRPVHLRPHSHETFSFGTTFSRDHIHLRLHSFYATLKWSCYDFLWITFLWSTFHFIAGNLKFCKVTLHLKFCKVTLLRVQGDSRWVVNALALWSTAEARKLLIPRVWKGALHLWSVILSDQVKELYVLRSCSFPLRGAAIVSVTEKWMTRKEKVSFSVGWNNHRRKRVLHECLKWTGLNPTSIKWMWSQMNVVSNEWSQMNLWQMKRSQLSAHPYTTYLYLQYNLRLWPGACQARKTTSSLAWFTRNNRYYSANATNGAVSMKTL